MKQGKNNGNLYVFRVLTKSVNIYILFQSIRQADRVILEHVSRTRGLTSGLQFLCSSASSLSAMFSGLRYALQQVSSETQIFR